MKLYQNSASPYARKPMVLLHEADAVQEVIIVNLTGSEVDPCDLPVGASPLGNIPFLQFDDGSTLFDSRVICEYLCKRFARFLRPNAENEWAAKRLEALADGIMDATLLIVRERKLRPSDKQCEAWITGQMAKIDQALDTLQPMAEDLSSFIHGSRTVGHFGLAIALGYLDFRLEDYNWRATRPHLRAWEADIVRRPSLQSTQPSESG